MKPVKICEGVYQVGGAELSDSRDCLVYAVVRDNEAVLIDAGAGFAPERIEKNLGSLGILPGCLKYIIATHGHIDHIGGLPYLCDAFKTRVAAHEKELAAIADADPRFTAADLYGARYAGCPVELILHGDDTIMLGEWALHCLHTPGHTPGGISVYFDNGDVRILFGQDIHGPFIKEWGANMIDWTHSMKRLMELDADILCEGHFGVYQPASRVRGYIESYVRRYGVK